MKGYPSSLDAAAGSARRARITRGLAAAAAVGSIALAPFAARAAGVADTVTVLPPVNVQGTRTPAPTRATGTEVRLDRAKIARFMPQTASDALVSVPGVDLVKTGPWASKVAVRGLSGDRVLVMVDGVRLNTVRGHGAQASLVSVDKLDAVEVMPGAGSAQYGSDALGGVVNFVTQRPLIEPDVRQAVTLSARASDPGGSWSQSARWRLSGPRFGLELSGGAGGQEYMRTPDGRIANSGSKERNLGGRAALRLGIATLDYERSQQRGYDIGLPAFGSRSGSAGTYPLQRRDLDRLELVVPDWARFAPETRVMVVGQAFQTDFDEYVVDTVAAGRTRYLKHSMSADRVHTTSWGVQPSLRFPRLAELRLSGEWRRETADGPRSSRVWTTTLAGAPAGTPSTAETQTVPPAWRDVWSGAAYVAPRLLGDGRLRLEAGARHDEQESHADARYEPLDPTRLEPAADLSDRRTSVEGGLSYDFGAVEPYAHSSTGFRAPNLDERFYDGYIHGALYVIGEASLRSERNLTHELGLKLRDLGPLTTARVSVYRSDVRDLIQLKPGTLYQGVMRFTYENVRRATIEGVEGTATLRFGSHMLSLSGTLPRAYERINAVKQGLTTDAGTARATVEMTVPLTHVMPHGLLSVRWRWNDAFKPREAATADAFNLARPSFHTTAVELSTTLGGTRAVFAIKNLFDHAYHEPLSFIPEPGRTFSMSMRRDFSLPVPTGNRKRPH
jgi:outer membrane receptor protein involved in Fe transport